ncbi:Hypp2993 [Branchiostoma lanceolatum]|uniref:Hypp2993 protein n=1 Tax=Branchiostoma lanceolatum TaxID=7740 RepID=A0A8K0EQ43_BRALA|nr:Hypp2993 [Branchiostoma lanceolatum]
MEDRIPIDIGRLQHVEWTLDVHQEGHLTAEDNLKIADDEEDELDKWRRSWPGEGIQVRRRKEREETKRKEKEEAREREEARNFVQIELEALLTAERIHEEEMKELQREMKAAHQKLLAQEKDLHTYSVNAPSSSACERRHFGSFYSDSLHSNPTLHLTPYRKMKAANMDKEVLFEMLGEANRRKNRTVTAPTPDASFPCSRCGRVCRSRIGLVSHQRACTRRGLP